MEGATYYYYEIPQNPVNDWLVATHQERFGTPPDFFTAGGMAAGIAVVEAIRRAGGADDTEALIRRWKAWNGRRPRAPCASARRTIRRCSRCITSGPRFRTARITGVPVLVREIGIDEMDIPIRN
jgi:branched-chain amino acid transport system substrate-binding protein